MLMSDKDILLSAIQTSHDLHTSKMDVLEDTLVSNEVNGANALVAHYTQWAEQRNRDRIAAIISHIEQNTQEIDALTRDGEDD
jgi:putative NADH-flavin reductase